MNPAPRLKFTILAALALGIATFIQQAQAAITIVDSDASAFLIEVSSGSIANVTASGANNVILVGISGEASGGYSGISVSWGASSTSTPLTGSLATNIYTVIYALTDMTPGTNTLSITGLAGGSGTQNHQVGVLSLAADNGFDPLDAKTNSSGSSSSLSITFDSAAASDDLVFGFGAVNGDLNVASSSLTSSLFSTSVSNTSVTGDYDANPSGATYGWSATGSQRMSVSGVLVSEAIPEPSAALLGGLGMLLLLRRRRD